MKTKLEMNIEAKIAVELTVEEAVGLRYLCSFGTKVLLELLEGGGVNKSALSHEDGLQQLENGVKEQLNPLLNRLTQLKRDCYGPDAQNHSL